MSRISGETPVVYTVDNRNGREEINNQGVIISGENNRLENTVITGNEEIQRRITQRETRSDQARVVNSDSNRFGGNRTVITGNRLIRRHVTQSGTHSRRVHSNQGVIISGENNCLENTVITGNRLIRRVTRSTQAGSNQGVIISGENNRLENTVITGNEEIQRQDLSNPTSVNQGKATSSNDRLNPDLSSSQHPDSEESRNSAYYDSHMDILSFYTN